MSDYKGQLERIEKTVSDKKIEKAKLEERLKRLEQDKAEILKELEVLEISPEGLDGFLDKESKELEKGIAECNKILQTA